MCEHTRCRSSRAPRRPAGPDGSSRSTGRGRARGPGCPAVAGRRRPRPGSFARSAAAAARVASSVAALSRPGLGRASSRFAAIASTGARSASPASLPSSDRAVATWASAADQRPAMYLERSPAGRAARRPCGCPGCGRPVSSIVAACDRRCSRTGRSRSARSATNRARRRGSRCRDRWPARRFARSSRFTADPSSPRRTTVARPVANSRPARMLSPPVSASSATIGHHSPGRPGCSSSIASAHRLASVARSVGVSPASNASAVNGCRNAYQSGTGSSGPTNCAATPARNVASSNRSSVPVALRTTLSGKR